MPNENDIRTIRELMFEIYQAGFEAGYSKDVDIRTAYDTYFKKVILPQIIEMSQ